MSKRSKIIEIVKSFGFAALLLTGLMHANTVHAERTAAEYAIAVDVESGITLFEKQADVSMAPASMSKLMTVLMIFEALKDGRLNLSDELYVSDRAWKEGGAASGGSTMFLEARSRVSVENLLKGVIIQSGNDACIVLAEGLSGSEENFASAMNQRAIELGLEGSHFSNSTGLPDPEHKMTARDLASLAKILITEHSEYYSLFSERSFTWNGITQSNRNPLLYANIGADGLKTGHTMESGYGLVASGEQNGRRVILVLNGLKDKRQRARETRSMLNWAMRSFTSEVLYSGGDSVVDIPVWHGKSQRVRLTAEKMIKVILPRSGRRTSVAMTVTYETPAMAPIEKGQKLAVLRITAPNMESQQFNLVAADEVRRAGLLGRAFASSAFLLFGQ